MKIGIVALFALMTLVACGNRTSTNSSENSCCTAEAKVAESGIVEVLYMHGKQRCVTCVAIETEAEAVIKELANNKVTMKTVNFSTPEGEKIADKYEIASSSIIVVKDGKVENLTAIGFQYAKSNPELFKKSLKETIQKMLK